MKALVTGAGGFVGPHLVDHLRAEGDDVVGTDRTTGLDLADADETGRFLDTVRPDVVYHLAGDSDVGGSWSHPVETFRANAEVTMIVLAAARAAAVERVVVIGSADVYGKVTEAELPLGESAELRPTSPYAASKVAAEFIAMQAHRGYGQTVVAVRPFNHLGPGQSTRFVAPAIAARIVDNERNGGDQVPVGNLAPRRDLTDVRDVVRAYRLLAQHGVGGEVYNVCSGADVSIGDLAQRLVALADRPMHLVEDPELQRPVDIPVLRGDNSRLRAATGWEPRLTLDESLRDLLTQSRRAAADR